MILRIIDKQTKLFLRDDFTFDKSTEIALDVKPAQGFYLPKWNGKQWIEGRTQAEIDAIKASSTAPEPTETEILQAEIDDLKARLAKVEAVPIVKTALEPIVKDPLLTK